MQSRAGWLLRWLMLGILVCQAGCDNTPNPNFEQSVKDVQAAQRGDRYSDLNKLPRQTSYMATKAELRAAFAGQQAVKLRATYDSMLQKLESAPRVSGTDDLLAECRASFEAAAAFQADSHLAPENAKAAATAAFERLKECRDRAVATGQTANKPEVAADASTLRRFASYGMVMVGLATIGHGDEVSGLELWRQGDQLAALDKPGFKLTPSSFR